MAVYKGAVTYSEPEDGQSQEGPCRIDFLLEMLMVFPMFSPSCSFHVPCPLLSSPGVSHVRLSGLSVKAAVKLCWDDRGVDVQKSMPGFGTLIVFSLLAWRRCLSKALHVRGTCWIVSLLVLFLDEVDGGRSLLVFPRCLASLNQK